MTYRTVNIINIIGLVVLVVAGTFNPFTVLQSVFIPAAWFLGSWYGRRELRCQIEDFMAKQAAGAARVGVERPGADPLDMEKAVAEIKHAMFAADVKEQCVGIDLADGPDRSVHSIRVTCTERPGAPSSTPGESFDVTMRGRSISEAGFKQIVLHLRNDLAAGHAALGKPIPDDELDRVALEHAQAICSLEGITVTRKLPAMTPDEVEDAARREQGFQSDCYDTETKS